MMNLNKCINQLGMMVADFENVLRQDDYEAVCYAHAFLQRMAEEKERRHKIRTDRKARERRRYYIYKMHNAGMTYEKLGEEFGVTRERIRQIYEQEKRVRERGGRPIER